jgi:hypothetical protein
MTEHQPQTTELPSRYLFLLSFAGAFLFLYLRTFLLPATPFVAVTDQALFFARAARIVHGQVLYRDFFELVTPGTDLLYAAAFRLFGIHVWIMQAWAIALGLALSSVITWIASRILRGPVILLPALLFLVFDFNSGLDLTHHWYSTLAALGAVSILTGGASLPRIFAAGSLCGIAALFTQTQGTLTLIALAVYLLWLWRSEARESSVLTPFATLVLPFLLILSCVLGYYLHKAGFRTIYFDLVVFPLKFLSSSEVNSPRTYLHQLPSVHALADLPGLVPYVFIYAVVPYIYLFGFHQLWRSRKTLPTALQQRLVLLHLVGLALFLAIVSGPRFFRLCTVAPPAILICTWLLSQQGSARRLARNLLCVLAIAFALLLPIRRQTQWHATLNLPIGRTAFSDIRVFREFQWLAQRTHPSEPFFNNAALSLYLSLNNPTPSEFVNYDEFTRPEQVAAVIQSLQSDPPHFILLLPPTTNPSDVHDHAAPFRQYVYDNYHLAQTFYVDPDSRYEQELWERGPKSDSQVTPVPPETTSSQNQTKRPLSQLPQKHLS